MCVCIIIRNVSKGCYRLRMELETLTPHFCPHPRADTHQPQFGCVQAHQLSTFPGLDNCIPKSPWGHGGGDFTTQWTSLTASSLLSGCCNLPPPPWLNDNFFSISISDRITGLRCRQFIFLAQLVCQRSYNLAAIPVLKN